MRLFDAAVWAMLHASMTLPRLDSVAPEPLEGTKQAPFTFPHQGARGAVTLRWNDQEGAHVASIEQRTIVGLAASSGIVVKDPTVSRLHAELDPRDDGVWIRDLGSRNGTFVDDVRVEVARLHVGARITLGSASLIVDEAQTASVQQWGDTRFGPLVGRSPAMRELFAQLARVAPLDSSVLIQGETGTGKELVAQAIHEASPRANKPFVVVDCAALAEQLLDSELFGHAKGSFTGAMAARVGAIEAAAGGTVFLDEVGELPASMQPKLLRVLESRTIRRVGETQHRSVDVRFICATHRDLLTMVTAGAFREDLFFRISVVPVRVPPLRERLDDIEDLVNHFLASARGPRRQLASDLLAQLRGRAWRGNVRELRNFVERALALGAAPALEMDRESQPEVVPAFEAPAAVPEAPEPEAASAVGPIAFDTTLREFRQTWTERGEREYLTQLLNRHARNVADAAVEAGVDRTYIYRLIRKYGL